MKKIFVLGSINMDLVISSPYLPVAGETIIGSDFMSNPGGKGANQATTCGKLGGEVFLIGAVGDDLYGEKLLLSLKNNNVNVAYTDIIKKTTSGVAVILLTENDNRIILDSGANFKVSKSSIKKCLNNYALAEDIFIAQLEVPVDTVLYGLKTAKEKGLFTILNPAPASICEKLYPYVDLIILNETEAKTLTNIEPINNVNFIQIAEFFKTKNINNVIITLGSKGAATIINNEVIRVNSIQVDAIDTTAAGDSFVGSIAVELAKGKNLLEAIKVSNVVAAITVMKEGAQQSIPTITEYTNFVKQNKL